MHKIVLGLIVAAMLLNFASFETVSTRAHTEVVENLSLSEVGLESGMYVDAEDEMGAWIELNEAENKWMTVRSLATSYAISGSYMLTENRIIALTENDAVEIELQPVAENEIKVISVRNDIEGLNFWVKEGMVFRKKDL